MRRISLGRAVNVDFYFESVEVEILLDAYREMLSQLGLVR